LHQGHAARAADQADAGRGRRALRHADPLLQGARVILAFDAGNTLVWIVWIVAAFACLGSGIAVVSFTNPFFSALALIGNLGALAVLYLLLSAEFVAPAHLLAFEITSIVLLVAAIGGVILGSHSRKLAGEKAL